MDDYFCVDQKKQDLMVVVGRRKDEHGCFQY